ncbi:MAG: diguanylate cyclase, partial [Acidobacteriota bacterium]
MWDARVLVGTGRGLALLDAPSGRVVALGEAFRAHRLDVLSIAAIRSAPGIAWIASGQDLFRAAGGGGRGPESVDRLEVPIRGSISALSTAASGRLWIGTDRGEIARAEWSGPGAAVAMRSLDAVSPSDRAALAAHGVVSALYEDPQGRLWVGTRRGLGRIDLSSGSVSWLGQGDGLPSTNIAGIEADEAGRLWIGHNRGITRLDPASGAMTHFGERDGAQGKGYAEGASVAGASGLIYFAGEGVTVFDPRQVSVNPYRPGIVFTALDVLHREVSPRWLDPDSPIEQTITATSELVLGPEATVFSVEMAPLHYADPMSNRLRYRLEGFDREWIEADAYHRVATYTNLAPGHYVLRARAETRSGLWSEGEATLAIRIRPAWWRSRVALAGWFVMAVAAAGAILAEARRRVRARLALQALRLDSLTDPLTGLHNRRFLVPFLEQEVPKLVREHRAGDAPAGTAGEGLLLLLIDVDRFKSFNDRHSHTVGDRVLSRIAGVLKEHTRGSDLAVRWGGDEFLVVSRSFQRTSAADAAERLRAAVEAIGPVAEGGPACTI